METKDLDILIPYKKDLTKELIYCLRSIDKNLPHRRIFIVGDRPDHIKKIIHIPSPQIWNKHRNVRQSVEKAINDHRLSENFIYFNNDMYVMRKVNTISNYNRGYTMQVASDLVNVLGYNHYIQGMIQTTALIGEQNQPLSYELHVPMIFNKFKLRDIYRDYSQEIKLPYSFQFRTLYGNRHITNSRTIKDVKIRKDEPIEYKNYLSTSDYSFNNGVGELLQTKFPNKGRYEI